MPKYYHKGKNQNRRTDRFIEDAAVGDDRSYYDHDNREAGGRRGQRGGSGNIIKSGRIDRHRGRPNMDTRRVVSALEDDVDMAGTSGQGDARQRFTPYNSRGRRPQDRRQGPPPRTAGKSDFLWNKILIPHGKKYGKDFILKTLLNATTEAFIPIYFHEERNDAVFYVEDHNAANALRALNKQFTMNDGFKLGVIVKPSPPPTLPINEELKTKIQNVMSRRYDPIRKLLNLSQFHLDEELRTQYYAPLSRDNVMQTVVKIINEHIPDVEAIDLSDNKIFSVEQMRTLASKATFLKSINLSSNKLSQVSALDRLQGLPLEELVLTKNPVCDQFSDRSTYISAVRKRFPKITKLDGVDLPPVISFDVGAEDVSMPSSKGSFFVANEAQQIAALFLQQYLAIYDSEDRQPLLDAYHDSAALSMTVAFAPGQAATGTGRLDAYMKDSRNLKRIDEQRRDRMLHQGKVDVVAFLAKLPKTTHDSTSLMIDVPIYSALLMQASVTGVFRERAERGSPIRWFQRVFIIVPQPNGGFCIINEQLHISNATTEQVKAAFKGADQITTNMEPVPPSVPAPVASTPVVNPATDPVLRQQMIQSFSEQSGMNVEWSLKCLEENAWDFDRAAYVFSELKNNNSIPPEAFIK